MSRFAYSAIRDSGERTSGVVRSASTAEAARKLVALGLHPISIHTEAQQSASGNQLARSLFGRVKTTDLSVFTRQLASLLKAGMPMVQALRALHRQSSNAELTRIIADLDETLSSDAASLSDAMERHSRVFSPVYRGLVRSGEESGNLAEVLNKMAKHLSQSAKLRGQVAGAFIYPIFLVLMGTGAVVVLMTFVVPKFKELFSSFGQQLPWPTRVLITTSSFLASWWWAILFVSLMGGMVGILAIRKPGTRTILDRHLLKVPYIGPVLMKVEVARIAQTLSTLLNSGIRMLDALQITGATTKSLAIRATFSTITSAVSSGENLSTAVDRASIFPVMMVSLIRTGEETSELPEMLSELASIYEEEAERAISGTVKLLEPLLIVVMGTIIAGIVSAIILPIFRANVMISQ